jgi:hypothetical protein
MSDNTFYGDFVMAAVTDDFFRWLTNEQIPTWADGHVDSPTGWFAVVKPEVEDVLAYIQEFGDPYISVKAPDGWFLVQIDTLGFVYTVSYEGLDGLRPAWEQRRRCLADFNRLSRLHASWCEG